MNIVRRALVIAALAIAIALGVRAQGIDNPGSDDSFLCTVFGICNSPGGGGGGQGTEVLSDSGNTELLADPTNAYILTH